MAHIVALDVDGIRLHKSWAEAPVGTLLQVSEDGPAPIIGIRCELFGIPAPQLLVLDGKGAGLFLSSDELGQRAAIDVTALVSICVKDAAPPAQQPHPISLG